MGGGAFGELYKVEKKKTGDFLAAKVEKAVKNQKHIMLFWASKLIHKLRGKTAVPNLHFFTLLAGVAATPPDAPAKTPSP